MSNILAQRGASTAVPSAVCAPAPLYVPMQTPVRSPTPGADLSPWIPSEFATLIAHEIKQPLSAILLQAAAARRWLERPQPDFARALMALAQIAASSRQADDIVQHMQALAERRPVAGEAVCLDTVLRQTLSTLACSLARHRIEARLMLGLEGVTVHGNWVQLGQIARNLLTNAIEALAQVQPGAGARVLSLSSRRLDGGMVELIVADNGPGVAPEHRAHIFTPRFSTREEGAGVGLSISAAIAEAHGGQLDHQPAAGKGAVFRLILPIGGANRGRSA